MAPIIGNQRIRIPDPVKNVILELMYDALDPRPGYKDQELFPQSVDETSGTSY